MRKVLTGLTLAAVMLASSVAPALAQTPVALPQTLTATVNVNSVVSVTLTDYGIAGLNFGNATPGVKVGDAGQDTAHGAVTLEVRPETTADCYLKIAGSANFIGPGAYSFPITALGWTKSSGGGTTAVTNTPVNLAAVASADAKIVEVWHYLTVPQNTRAGEYTASVTYSASTQQ
ncbi:MAG: hypothetical protein M1401_05745 [Chloroflexi bacterium]|nr:hypothetical protein [Chloroflexota bacterium]